MKPFLKWAGNKYPIRQTIQQVLPQGERLIEPFAGSCAIFLNTDYPRYLLAEHNPDLIKLYQVLKKEGAEFIDYSRQFFKRKNNVAKQFYELRELFNSTDDRRLKSALFVYLNKHCYNGLCRYNSQREFNVPFGQYEKPYFPEREMQFFAEKIRNASLLHADFLKTMQRAKPGDVVYCDPPYIPLSKTAYFTQYGATTFDESHQIALAKQAKALAKKGIPVVISNHNTPFIQEIYTGATITTFSVRRHISRDIKNRNKAPELLAVFS